MGFDKLSLTMKSSKHILIIRLSAMGDVAMVVPVVYAFAKANPDTKITFLSKAFFRPILETIPNVHFVAAETEGKHKGILGLWRLSRELKVLGITHVADVHDVLRSKILRKFLGLPNVVIDKGRAEKKALTSAKNKDFKPLKTTIQRYTEVIQGIGGNTFEPIAIAKLHSNEAVLDFTGSDTKKWIGIAPFAAHQGKQYPLDLMREVILALDQEVNVRLFLFGAPQETEPLEALSKDCDSCSIVAGNLNFKDQINLIAQLDSMLSMDSGNGHLAAMFGIPTVTLWGVTHPYAGFAPFGQEEHCILSNREHYPLIPTSVYGNKVPEGYEDVMRSIAPEEVVRKIEKILSNTKNLINQTAKQILLNKPNYKRNLEFLDSKYDGRFSNLLAELNNDINVLSLFSEMEFGYLLHQLFSEVIYEPKIKGKLPDWLVTSAGQKIIFEVKKINPNESELEKRIGQFKKGNYKGVEKNSFETSLTNFLPQISKISNKESAYRELITQHNYKLIICIDVISLHNEYITDIDLKEYLNFNNKLVFEKYPEFCENVAGIIGKPKFGNLVFIENKNSKFGLNKENLEILKQIRLS